VPLGRLIQMTRTADSVEPMRRLVAPLVLVLALAACGSDGAPESFTDQPGPLPESLTGYAGDLIGSADADQVPLVQRNFLEGCMSGEATRLQGLSGRSLADACGCSYDSLVNYLIDNSTTELEAFDRFVSIDRAVEDQTDEADPIGSQYIDLFDTCRSQAA
jgi:hypothetical protein